MACCHISEKLPTMDRDVGYSENDLTKAKKT
jgi:hypothetical protein